MRVLLAVIILSLAATSAPAQKEDVTERYSVAFDAGFPTDYDDSNRWANGYDAGVTALWAWTASTSFCARFGISHWSYVSEGVVHDLIPPGAQIEFQQSTGQIELLSLTPMIRYQREHALGRLGAFGEGGAGLAYVKTFALTDVGYSAGPDTEVENFEINKSQLGASVMIGAGVSHPVSSSSWIDLVPTYRAIFTGDVAQLVAVSLAFRLRV